MIAEACTALLIAAFNNINTEPAIVEVAPLEPGISARAYFLTNKVVLDPAMCDMSEKTRDLIIAHEVGHLISYRLDTCVAVGSDLEERLADKRGASLRPDLMAHIEERCAAGYQWYCEKLKTWRE